MLAGFGYYRTPIQYGQTAVTKKPMRAFLILLVGLALGGCGIVYKLPTRQGNVIEQKQLDKLEMGMTRDQVRFLLGTPIAVSPFRDDRWDYMGYYKPPRGNAASRIISIYFADGKVSKMDGVKGANPDANIGALDAQEVISQKAKEKNEDERAKGDAELHGGVFAPEPNKPDSPEASQVPNP